MKKQSILILLFSIPFLGISQLYTPGTGVTDIDGNTYQTIIINGQEWMSENLRTSNYANGDSIPNVTDNTQWSNYSVESNDSLTYINCSGYWVYNNNNIQNENPYGKLYNWFAVVDTRNLCPADWHVPSEADWSNLINYIDPNANGGNTLPNIAGGKMKSIGTQYWNNPNSDATNESGFSGLPGGDRSGYDGWFPNNQGYSGLWWSKSENNSESGWKGNSYSLGYDWGSVRRISSIKTQGASVRCLKNTTANIEEIKIIPKTLIRIFDIMGVETIEKSNEVLFYQYSDGSVEKKLIIE